MPSTTARTRKAAARGSRRQSPAGAVYLTREVHFSAAHRLRNADFGRRWNESQYGRCSNLHGHNYVLEATVSGRPDPKTGYIIDLTDLKRILYRAVVEPCDHRNLDEDVKFLRGVIPTAENLAVAFWGQIERLLPGVRLHCVRVYETPRNFAEYYGP